jgi:GxxExxY protein
MSEPTAADDRIARAIVDAAFAVHTARGPGLLESVYGDCLACELDARDVPFERQVRLPVYYRTIQVSAGLRMDFVVAGRVVVEFKATEQMLPVHAVQLLTYVKLSGYPIGLLINFNVVLIKHGIKRMINTRHSGKRPKATSTRCGRASVPCHGYLRVLATWRFNQGQPHDTAAEHAWTAAART